MCKKCWGENSQNLLFGRFLTKIWPFWAKYAHFGLFLPNATINVPYFRHRNIFFGLLKNSGFFFGAKFSNLTFWPFLTILGQICSFRPISHKRYYKCSSFSTYKHIFWSFKKWRNFFPGGNSQIFLFERFCPFWAKYAHFGLFLPNTTINVPHFRHRNIFCCSFKKCRTLFPGKNSQICLFGRFFTKYWPFCAKYAHFGIFLPNTTINVPHFRHRNIYIYIYIF